MYFPTLICGETEVEIVRSFTIDPPTCTAFPSAEFTTTIDAAGMSAESKVMAIEAGAERRTAFAPGVCLTTSP